MWRGAFHFFAPVLSIVVTMLGVLFTFLQLFHKDTSESSITPQLEISRTKTNSTSDKPDHQTYSVLVEGIELGVSKQEGALVVYGNKNLRGKHVYLYTGFLSSPKNANHHSTNNIVERTVNGRAVFTAIFPSLEPGNYTVGRSFRYYNEVTVLAGRVTEVDWR